MPTRFFYCARLNPCLLAAPGGQRLYGRLNGIQTMTTCPNCGETEHFAVRRLTWVLRPAGDTKKHQSFQFAKQRETLPDLNGEQHVVSRCLHCGHEF